MSKHEAAIKTAPRVATNGHRSLYHEVGLQFYTKKLYVVLLCCCDPYFLILTRNTFMHSAGVVTHVFSPLYIILHCFVIFCTLFVQFYDLYAFIARQTPLCL